jgi:phosphatidylglycerophosphate synthase
MKSEALIYVPSDTPEAMWMATRKVAGVPLIVRNVMTLAQAGIKKCTLLIVESQREKIEHFLAHYRKERLPQIDMIGYDEPYRVSPNIVRTIGEQMAPEFILVNANLLFETQLIDMIRSMEPAGEDILLCQAGAHPIPIYGVTNSAWGKLLDFTTDRPRSIQSCLAQLLESNRCKIAHKPPEVSTFLVSHLKERIVAEKFLAENIRLSTGGPIAKYINKRISLPISLILSKMWISPNAITAVNIVIGLFSGVFVADGYRYSVILLGAILFQIASIVDGCDGEVAKLTFRTSKFGQYIDTLSDNLSLCSFLIGMVAGYWRHTHSFVAFYVGGMMFLTTGITLFWMIRYLKQNTKSASLVTFDKEYLQKLQNQPKALLLLIKYGKYLLKKDVFSFMFLCSAVAGILYWWLYATTLGTTAGAIILTYLGLQTIWKESRVKKLKRVEAETEAMNV